MSTEMTDLSATELVAAFRARRLSPVEVLDAVLARLREMEPRLNAFRLVDEATGLAMARASERRWMAGTPAGLLDGVPVSIKDTNLTAGWPTAGGSRTTALDGPWTEDQPVVARLREHGAVFFGKTTTPEFGWKGVTDSPLTGVTRNPWNLMKTPGGSSGGAAAALAVGIGPLATGGDGGGSIRIPCSFTGLFGLKPTYGLVPNLPTSLGSLGVPGPMGRNVRDCALMLRVIAGPDHRDPYALPHREVDYPALLEGGVRGMRIGYSEDLGFGLKDPEVLDHVRRAVAVFEDLGAIVEPVALDLSDAREPFETLWRAGFAGILRGMSAEKLRQLDPGLLHLLVSAGDMSGATLQRAIDDRTELSRRMRVFHADHDLLVTPTIPIPAFEAGLLVPEGGAFAAWYDWTPLTWPFNMTRQPAASCPCGVTDQNLPVGLQIVGPLHGDVAVLRASLAFERARPFTRWRAPR